MSPSCITVLSKLTSLVVASAAIAQTYDLSWYTIDGGGQMFTQTASETYALSGTIGQLDAGCLASETYMLTGGFWLPAPGAEAKRPMAEACGPVCGPLYAACWSDTDCANDSRCIPAPLDEPGPGTCYAPKNRYLSIASHPAQVPNTARRMRCAVEGAILGWLGEPVWAPPTGQHDGLWLSDIVATPYYAGSWPDVVHVTGSGIMPPARWHQIQAIEAGQDPFDEENYSEPLSLPTVAAWWDVVGADYLPGGCTPPDGVCDEHDAEALDNSSCPLTWLDVCPEEPNHVVSLEDKLCVADCPPALPWEPWCDAGPQIPAVSEWGLVVMTLLLLTVATVVIGRRRPAAA